MGGVWAGRGWNVGEAGAGLGRGVGEAWAGRGVAVGVLTLKPFSGSKAPPTQKATRVEAARAKKYFPPFFRAPGDCHWESSCSRGVGGGW